MAAVRVRVTPRSSRNEAFGLVEGVLQIRVSAPPVEGAANKAVTQVLSDLLNIPRSSISIRRGQSGRDKTFTLSGLTEAELQQRLGEWTGSLKA